MILSSTCHLFANLLFILLWNAASPSILHINVIYLVISSIVSGKYDEEGTGGYRGVVGTDEINLMICDGDEVTSH